MVILYCFVYLVNVALLCGNLQTEDGNYHCSKYVFHNKFQDGWRDQKIC